MSPTFGQVLKNITLPPIVEQIFKDLTFEVGFNKSKVFNTKKISSFEAEGEFGSYIVNIKKEFYPITANYNMSIGYSISKKHHIRLRYAKNTLGSMLIGSFNIIEGPDFPSSPPITLDRRYSMILSKSIGIIYEYQVPYYEGKFVLGAGFERNKNRFRQEIFIIPGIQSRSYSFHSHFGYLAEINQSIQLHGKIFSTYYFANNRQIYNSPINSKYVPLQIGFEIALRVNLDNGFRHPKQSEKRRRRNKMHFIIPY